MVGDGIRTEGKTRMRFKSPTIWTLARGVRSETKEESLIHRHEKIKESEGLERGLFLWLVTGFELRVKRECVLRVQRFGLWPEASAVKRRKNPSSTAMKIKESEGLERGLFLWLVTGFELRVKRECVLRVQRFGLWPEASAVKRRKNPSSTAMKIKESEGLERGLFLCTEPLFG